MRLSWDEIRANAAAFSKKWENASREKSQTQTFYNEFFGVFGARRTLTDFFEYPAKRLGKQRGSIDLFWPGRLLVEQKSAGINLELARKQAQEYCDAIKKDSDWPPYILLSDFQTFILIDQEKDKKEGRECQFQLSDLYKHVEKFGFILDEQERKSFDQDPVNIKASDRMARVRDALENANYTGHDLNQFLVRLVFCMFADYTGMFRRRMFIDFINRTREDGSDLGSSLQHLFEVLDMRVEDRPKSLSEHLSEFPHVNGDLFKAKLQTAALNSEMRQSLIAAGEFDWSPISPAIFGSLFQSGMDKEERHQQGVHYTIEKNILKVIEPLFLDDLKDEFEKIKKQKTNHKQALQQFHEKLGRLKFFDPACGCGDFLIITYRELRRLEIKLLEELYPEISNDEKIEYFSKFGKVGVDQFYGIELNEFGKCIAETALWMMDHLMNDELNRALKSCDSSIQHVPSLPLKASPHIKHGDALEMDWNDLLPAAQCSYVFGNPPFGGAKTQNRVQRAQVHRIAALGRTGGTLDYVTSWFLKAGEYVQQGKAKIGFVATNSITQGEQVGQLWPLLFDRYGLEIAFAHRTFAWESEASGKAHVHVVIIGLTRRDMEAKEKRLFSYPDINGEPEESRHAALSPYLFDSAGPSDRHLVIKEVPHPINGLPKMIIGSQPIDGGHYIFTEEEKSSFLDKEPGAEKFLHPFIGAKEYLQGGVRYILTLQNAPPKELQALPEVKKRIAAVKKLRQASKRKSTQRLANTPTLYQINVLPKNPFLVVPETSSERRDYVPMSWLKPPVIPSNSFKLLFDVDITVFGLLTSAMHMAWMRTVTGRLESRYNYSIGVVYNTFPMPSMTERQKDNIGKLSQAVLDARAAHPTSTLANLYDPDLMPPNLRKAHQALDKAVDRLYRRAPFASERERVEHLFALYEKMTSPLTAKPKRRRGKLSP